MIIYEAFNKENGKCYIGLTTKSLKVRKSSHIRSAKSGSKTYFHKALRKYGEDSFEWSVIAKTTSLKSLYKLESLFISLYEKWQLYNISSGGEHSAFGLKHSQKTKDKCSKSALERWNGKRARDKYPSWVFELKTYREAKLHGVPKTTWYRNRDLT